MVNFLDANTELSQSHIGKIETFDKTVALHVPIIDDDKKSKREINEAKERIRDAWDNEYRQARQIMKQYGSKLFQDKIQPAQNNKRKTPPSNKAYKTPTPPEKKSKPSKDSECDMCKLRNRKEGPPESIA